MSSLSSPNRVLYLDPANGLAGDMFLGLLIDLGADINGIRDALDTLSLSDWSIEVEQVKRNEIGATRAAVAAPEQREHRHLSDILALISLSKLSKSAKSNAINVFTTLAEAEARVHRVPVEQIHFHEVGAVDAIIDICGVCVALDQLNIDEIVCGPLPAGSGSVTCEHGTLSVPVPAVLELAAGRFELVFGKGEGEMVTPTGMSLVSALGRPIEKQMRFVPRKTGYGAGARATSCLKGVLSDLRPSLVHVTEEPPTSYVEEVALLKAHVDDITGERIAYAMGRLMEEGALDVTATPCLMKKGRPATAIEVISAVDDAERLGRALMRHTLSLGVRVSTTRRWVMPRHVVEVDSPFGVIRVKASELGARPEYEDCLEAARVHDVDLDVVRQAALKAFETLHRGEG